MVAVRMNGNNKSIVMINAGNGTAKEANPVPLTQDIVYLKAECDFTNKRDTANFYYSLDGAKWILIGSPLKMTYSLAHFMGYRFGLFNYSTKSVGGYVDFDFFHIEDNISKKEETK
jgi:beta-xylosidase